MARRYYRFINSLDVAGEWEVRWTEVCVTREEEVVVWQWQQQGW